MLLKLTTLCFAFMCFLCSVESSVLSFQELLWLKKSYSLIDNKGVPLDKKLLKILKEPNQIFIEVGGNDGVSQSNTKLFEEFYGWRGLLVEASANLIKKCKRNRPMSIVEHYALVSSADVNHVFWRL